jgi:hypothetical protein|tara:strand:- start:1514 stop:2176 length:663 start_codon:yes stop_codon:yes gene_type:complete
MKVINFKNEPKNNPFSPEWNYFMCETQTKDINFKKLAKYLLDKEKKILKLPISKDINNKHTDGYTKVGFNSTTSRFQNFNVMNFKNTEIIKLKQNIIDAHNLFLKAVGAPSPNHLYIQCWYNVLRKGQEIKLHLHGVHPNIYLGGHVCVQADDTSTFYINTPNQINEPSSYQSKNEVGKLTLFQNFIAHYTNKNNSKSERITIAFDLSPVKLSDNYIRII